VKTIQDVIRKWAGVSPERTSLVSSQGSALSYRELAQAFDWLGATLLERELGDSPRLATVLPSGILEAVTFLGVSCHATAAPLNPEYAEGEFEAFLADLSPQALLLEDGFETPARGVARTLDIPIIELPSDMHRWGPAGDAPTYPEFLPSPEDTALLLSTSGTTSRPKRVPLTHANLIASAENVARSLQLGPHDRCLNPMPLFHIHGLVAGLLAPLIAGGSAIVASGVLANGLLQWIDSGKSTWYTAVPTIHQAILAETSNRSRAAQHRLRFIRSSSAPLPTSLQAEMETVFGVPVIEAYGMTEASHQIASNPLPPHPRKPGSVGRASGVEVAVLSPDGHLQPANAEGEIVIRGETVTSGYEGNSEANVSAFIDGWFRTGDAGHVDNDGYIYLTGRMKEMINRGGEKIAPLEIDEALSEHPAVARAIAFAVPHRTLSEDVAAAVVLHNGMNASEAELRSYLLERIAEFKVPSRFVFVDDIPKGPTGKLQRIGLADRLAAKLVEPFRPPTTPVESSLAQIWQEVLQVDHIGAADNFFMLGGDSLSTARILARVNCQFDVHLTLRQAFESPKLEDLAVQVELQILDSIEGRTND